jgi:succinate-semialdehyde dehydrogenase/glutarate-semialdehyde dehydrogenase
VSNATEVDAREALEAASSAQEEWARTPARTRSEILRRAFEALRAREREIALLIALESGKPLADAHAELDYGADFLRWYAEEAVRPAGDYRDAPAGDKRILASAQPVGPCLLIHPVELPAGDGDAEGRAGARRWDAP